MAAATSDTATAKSSARHSTTTSSIRGSPAGANLTMARTIHHASGAASRPPAAASSRLSANCARARRPTPAPSAARTARSVRRAAPRISSRLATFTLAMSRTSSTAPNRARTVGRVSPTTMASNGCTAARNSSAGPTSGGSSCGAMASSSAAA